MKQKKGFSKPYGLRANFTISLLVSGVICGLLFFAMYYASESLLTEYFARSDFEEIHVRRQGESLQSYIDKNGITRSNLSRLTQWEKRQPVILLELYSGERCIYSSFYDVSVAGPPGADKGRENAVSLRLGEETVTAVLFSDFTYQYYLLGVAVSFAAALLLFIALFLRSTRRLIHYICKLNEDVQILEGGNLEYQICVQGNDEITDLAKSMNRMRLSLREQMETEQQLHEAYRRLVTEMSHDLRTPLTGMMLYLEILRTHRYESEAQLQDYLEKIDAKAHHLKILSDHLFEYTLDGALPRTSEPVGMEQAFSVALSHMTDDLKARGFRVVFQPDWQPCFVQVKQEYVQRIFENILSNITKYAEPSAEVHVETICTDRYCGFSVMNACRASDTGVESNQIGLESIQTLMRQMGGVCTVEQTEVFFEITLLFPKQ